MKLSIVKRVFLTVVAVFCAGGVWAQFSANYQTNTIDGVAVNWAGDYSVGSNTCFNVLQVLNGGALTNVNAYFAFATGSSNNLALVSGSGSKWYSSADMNMGYSGSDNRLTVSNGGQVTVNSRVFVGRSYTMVRNHLEVTGSGSVLSCANYFAVGHQGPDNLMTISDGGQVLNTLYGMVGNYSGGNKALVTGPGSLWKSPSDLYVSKGQSVCNNQLIVTNCGWVVNKDAYIAYDTGSTNNSVLVTGVGSVWTNTGGMGVGAKGSYNELTVTAGGQVVAAGSSYVGTYAGANSNSLVVSGSGSLFKSDLEMGREGKDCRMFVTNGGLAVVRYGSVGSSSNGNQVVVSGANSRWEYATLAVGNRGSGNQMEVSQGATVAGPINPTQYNYVIVGVNSNATGNILRIASGALLDANTLIVTNAGNSIVNSGGIYQFSSATPTIATNGFSATSPIVLTNGTVSFRNIMNAPLRAGTQLTRIDFQGDNGYRLNGATNASVTAYTFDSVANTGNPANYQRLYLCGINPRWQGNALTIGTGGTMWVSNTHATVSASFTNNGALYVNGATVSFAQAATLNGTVVIDLDNLGSTNGVVASSDLKLGEASTLQLSGGPYTNEESVVLFRYTGTRSGTFFAESGVPSKYRLLYGSETDGTIRLIRAGRETLLKIQ